MLNARRFDRLTDFVHDRITLQSEPGSRGDLVAAVRDGKFLHMSALFDIDAVRIS